LKKDGEKKTKREKRNKASKSFTKDILVASGSTMDPKLQALVGVGVHSIGSMEPDSLNNKETNKYT
jgi:K+-transporting ATPase c subunit